ncbi:MAG: cation:proton antiporter [Candidatus Aenigmatarchaeota archaeon]
MIDTISLFTLLGITLLLGYVCSLIFKKTQIPDVIWLLLFGFFIGPVFNLVDRSIFIAISPLLAAFALLIILFQAGLEMNFFKAIRQFPRGILLSIVGITITIVSIALVSKVMFNFDWIQAFLLGSIIGGPSSAIVISVLKKLNVREDVRIILDLESIFTDPIDVVLTIALLQIYVSTLPLYSIIGNITAAFSIGAVMGFIFAIIWLVVLSKLKNGLDYMLTLAILLLLYSFVESVNGSGAVASLIFGIVLGSSKLFSKAMRFRCAPLNPIMKKFHEELTFFVKSFFFVTMGIIVSISTEFVVQGVIITIVIALTRILAVFLSTYGMKLTKLETNIMRVNIPQGLATAVMAYMPLIYGVKDANIFLNVAFVVIIGTIVYTTIGVKFLYSRNRVDVAKKT